MDDIGAYRNDGPDTMIEGALAVAPKLQTLRGRVFSLFLAGEMTDAELVSSYRNQYGEGEYRSLSTRRRELVDAGMIVDSGRRKENPASKVSNIIWTLTPRGRVALGLEQPDEPPTSAARAG